MKHIVKKWLAGILSVVMVFSLLPVMARAEEDGETPEKTAVEQVQALIDALPDADTITAENRTDVQAQIDAIDAAMLELTEDQAAALDTTRYDATVAALLALDAPSALEQVQALIDALPDAESITDDNRADVEAQLAAIDEAKQDLTDDELDALDITRYMAAVEAILALDGMSGADEPETIATDLNVGSNSVNISTDGEYTITGSTASNTITVTGGTVTITLNGVSVTSNGGCAFDIKGGDVTLILADGTTNSFTSAGSNNLNAGIHVAENAHLTIRGTGALNAVSEYRGAGIGGNQGSGAGHITIESGNITAKSNADGAGIGGGHTSESSATGGTFQSITITGGKVTAEGGGNGAGIGNGCWGKTLGTISISGGIIHAKTAASAPNKPSGGDRAYDIGYSHSGSQSGGTISITGGVIFTENRGIKNPSYSNCLVVSNSGDFTIYGSPTITGDVTIPSGKTLTVPSGSTLTVAEGATLTNEGSISNSGNIVISGTGELDNKNEIYNAGSIEISYTGNLNNEEGTIKNVKGYGKITGDVTGTQPEVVEGVSYLDWDQNTKTLVEKAVPTTIQVGDSTTTWENNWYVVSGNVTISDRITIKGTVHLILMDDCTLTAQNGISVNPGNSLTIYGQSGQSGSLSATGSEGNAGIGGDNLQGFGTITINGGIIIADGYGNGSSYRGGAGIGGGGTKTQFLQDIQSTGGTVTINGGTVTADGGETSAGVGGGYDCNNVTITINGGTVVATGLSSSAGIGGGESSKNVAITINEGNVTATGGSYGPGIGCAMDDSDGITTININGGTVTATGGSSSFLTGGGGAGIGGADDRYYGTMTININGGTVTATGGRGCAGIGRYSNDSTNISFSTGKDGNAVIVASGISDKGQQNSWSGIIIEGNTGKIYGTPTPKYNFEIPSGKTLNVENGHPLHIASDVTMTNKGTINIGTNNDMEAVLNNEGSIINEGKIDVWGLLTHGEDGIEKRNSGEIVYHFNLAVDAPTFAEAKYGYSQPSALKITIKNNGQVDANITSVEIDESGFDLIEGDIGNVAQGATNDSWSVQPKAGLSVGTHTATITVTYSGNGGTSRTATAEVSFTVTKANPKVTVSASGDPTYGSDITLTAEVTATGVVINDDVTFKAGTEELGTARAENGTATLVIKGTDTDKQKDIFDNNEITAEYAGDDNIESKSGTEKVTVKPKTLTFTFHADSRAYDKTTEVKGSFDLIGVMDGDVVNVSDYTASVDSPDAGTQTVTIDNNNITLGGADARYYTPGTVTGGTVEITQAELDLTISDVSITYGTKLTDNLLSGTAKIQGTATTITGTFAWEDQNAVPTVSDSGNKNYKVIFTPTLPEKAENFTEASRNTEITVTVGKATSEVTVDAVNGTYGESITITANVSASGVDANFVTGEVEFTDGGTTLGTAEVENGVATLTISGSQRNEQHTLFGSNGSSNVTAKYSGDSNIDGGSDNAAVNITPKALTYTVTATDKVYNGDAAVEVQLVPNNLVPGDSVTLTATGSLSSADANTYHQVNLSNIAQGESDDAKYYSVDTQTVENATIQGGVTISPKVVELVWKLDGSDTFTISYDGDPHTATATVNNKVNSDEVGVTVEVKPNSGIGAGPYDATATDAGSYTATATGLTGAAHGNYTLEGCDTATQTVTISKVLATCTTPPTANENLTYTGEAQQLVTAGTPTGGEMRYALGDDGSTKPGNEAFYSGIPTGTNAGTYYVWYYVQGDGNHDDSEKKCVEVSIAKAEVTFEVSKNSYTYDGEAKKVTLANSNTSDAPELVETSDYTVTYGSGDDSEINVGEYEIHIKLTEAAAKNYKFAEQGDGVTELTVAEKKLSITKATSTVSDVTITGKGEGLTYGDTFTISAKVNAPDTMTGTVTFEAGGVELGQATSHDGGVWTITVDANDREKQHAIFGTGENTTITAEYSGDKNIEASNGSKDDVTVAPKPLMYSVTATGRVWNGGTGVEVALAATNTVTGDVVTLTATGNLDNDGKAGTYSKVNLSEVQIGGADKGYYTTEEAKDNVELTANIVIEKAESSVTAPAGKSGLTYTGNPQELIDEATDVVGGAVKYFVGAKAPDDGASEWKTEVDQITGTNAGTYKVWYYVDGDENHNDSTPASVEVTIDPAEVSFTIGAENKDDWGTKGETNADPNPTGYTLGGSGTDYKLSMIYDSYGHKANVIQTAGEAVKIEAGDANGFTVTYKKDGTGPDLTEITDAGTYDIIVNLTPAENTEDVYNFQFNGQGPDVRSLKIGTVTVTPFTVHVTWSHLKYIYHAHPMHPTVKVQNALNSDVQPTTVPEDFDPEAGYDGKLLAYAVTDGSNVGDYEVTVKLYGTSAGNYTVEDATGTVSILAAPVTFTIGDNIWDITKEPLPTNVTLRAAWGEVTTTPDVAVHHKYPGAGTKLDVGNLNTTIEYRKDDLTYTAPDNPPTEAGTYEVWVKIGNENYRHSATDSGDFHKVGELILTDNPDSIRSYTITFDPNYDDAPNGPDSMEKIFEKQTVIIPSASGVNEDGTEYDITRDSYRFLGWSYGGLTYQPNEEFIMPANNVDFKAEWVLAVDVSGTVKQGEDESTAKALPGATVTLKNGAEEVAETTTDNQGKFKLEQVAPGIYNLEIRYQSGSTEIIKTFLVEVGENGSLDGTYLLPTVALNTVVEVTPGITAAVDMGGIVSGEDITDVYTPDDRETVRNGGTVEFRMSIQSGTLTPDQAEEVPVPEDRIGMVLDLELTKTVTKSGTGSTETDIHDTKIPVTTVIHLPAELQGKSSYTIYRFHDMENEEDSETLEMQTITTSPNSDGEYLKIVRDGTAIEIHAEFYSTYVLTWQQSSGGGGISRYPVNLPSETDDGTITSNPTSAIPGSRVTLTVKPDEGYHIGFLTVTDRNGKPVELTDNGDGTYTFTQPYGQVTVKVEFMKCGSLDFTDLDTKAWYHDYTDYAIAHGLMQGTGGGLFDPDGIVNRAQMVMVLWNLRGKPVVNYYMTYSDVTEDTWYSEAVRWATSEGIAGGYGNGKFGPNDSITREQMTTMIYRYEQKYGDGGFTGDWMYRLPFKDLDQISDWAFEAVAWCNVKGVITGKGNNIFDPKGFAKRSEMAAILTRYSEMNIK